jgi:hypothetical protein
MLSLSIDVADRLRPTVGKVIVQTAGEHVTLRY